MGVLPPLFASVLMACGPAISIEEEGSSSTGPTPNPGSSSPPIGSTSGEDPPPATSASTSPPPPETTSGFDSTTTGPDPSTGESSVSLSAGFLPTDLPPDGPCDPYLQDCPPGEKCNPYADNGGSAWNALGCFPVAEDPDQVGEPCAVEGSGVSGIDTCDIGQMCWSVDLETNMGTCVAMCEGSQMEPSCDAGTACVVANDGVLNLCLTSCDPIQPECLDDETCYPIDQTFICVPFPGETLEPGDPCESPGGCGDGLACVAPAQYGPECVPNSLGCCSPYCDTTAPPDCLVPEHECVPLYPEGMAPPGYENLGWCQLP